MSSKSNSAFSETPTKKPAPAISGITKSSRGVAKPSTDSNPRTPSSRLSSDRSPLSVESKPTQDRRSPKLSTPPDAQTRTPRAVKSSDRQAELNAAQEDLKKTKEKLALLESEQAKTLDELKQARILADEANENIREALMAQKKAEESSEIEKFRAVEMEQAGIEAVQKKEDEWQIELEAVRSQHSDDVASLLSATRELQKVKEELSKTSDAKNLALSHADDATKLAEGHAEKVESLSAKLVQLTKEVDSRVEQETNENDKIVSGLILEIDSLRQELEEAKHFEEMLAETEATLEQLSVDLEAAKMAESYAHNLAEELSERVEELAAQADQAKSLERSASESLESVIKQLEGSNYSLHNSECEIASLKEKMGLLEISIGRHKTGHEESERLLKLVKEESSQMVIKVECLVSDLESIKDEKTQALHNEQLAASSLQTLLEEKNKLMDELQNSREEEEKSKKALESLASALHEVSSEARTAKEKLLSLQDEHENYETQIKDLNLVLKTTNEKYDNAIDDAKLEIDELKSSIEQSEHYIDKLKAEWEQKEIHLINSLKKSVEECSSMENEVTRLVNLIKMTEEEASAMKEEEDRWKKCFKEAELEVISLKEVLSKTIAENKELEKNVMDKENELQSILLENEDLQNSEAACIKKVEDLSKLLDEALVKKQGEENSELTDSEKDYDMLPKVVEFSEQNGKGDMKPVIQVQPPQIGQPGKNNLIDDMDNQHAQKDFDVDYMNNKPKEFSDKGKSNGEPAEIDLKMWENCKIEAKDYSPEVDVEQESFDDELESKAESSDGHDQVNGLSTMENLDSVGSSPLKQRSHKKKKPLLHKFGNLLKKKSSTNQK